MSTIDVKVHHTLSQEEALARIKKMFTDLKNEHGDTIKDVSEEWNAHEGKFSFSAKGFSVSGKIHIAADTVKIHGKLPMMLSFFKSTIANTIKEKADKLLSS